MYKAEWRNQIVAAKLVDSSDEISYRNEIEIYENCNMVHENILGYVYFFIIIGLLQFLISNILIYNKKGTYVKYGQSDLSGFF